ncbi:FxLD family lanthipeptide [Pseudofrankia sp. BMG5.36]|uniref:FxLD family lanthipeptide n=1 Tax=Pseudofrankia sp. BMG5.36 TaxID=1834512 RepID=UPI0009F29143|nr:FxLD family lanthipeptide [Pseudofrankia sp. BMG5.36]
MARQADDVAVLDRELGEDVFDLDVTLVEMTDAAGLVNVTDDNCTSTCGACITNSA